jgi:hypothetical protein
MTRPVLVLGLPRSGTTWTAQILAAAPGAIAVMEPDNEKTSAMALGAKHEVGRFPVLDPAEPAVGYGRLWSWALAGAPSGWGLAVGDRLLRSAGPAEREAAVSGRPSARLRLAGRAAHVDSRPAALAGSPGGRGEVTGAGAGAGAWVQRVVAKSVHAPLAAEWLARAFDVDVLVLLRHPANVLASWLELDLPDRDRGLDRLPAVRRRYITPWGIALPGPTALERAVWHLGLMTAALEEAAARHPQWTVRVHEDLCVDPAERFQALFGDLGLEWTEAVMAEIEAGDRPGAGFALQRRSSEAADAWRTRLGATELEALRRGLADFPLQHWSADDMPSCA